MGTAESVLPEGPAAEALQEMVKPKRIGIGQNFWFELLKVQLPGRARGTMDLISTTPKRRRPGEAGILRVALL